MKRHVLWLALALSIVFMALTRSTGSITGIVVSDDGAPLQQAVVKIAGTKQSAFTKADGSFKITGIKASDRTLEVLSAGMAKLTKSIRVVANKTIDIGTLQLTPAPIQLDTVRVQQTPVVRQMEHTSSAGTVTREELAVTTRTATVGAVALQSSTSTAGSNGYSVRSGRTNETSIRVDGIEIDGDDQSAGGYDNSTGSVQVMGSGYSAEYGDVGSGIVNTTPVEAGNVAITSDKKVSAAAPQKVTVAAGTLNDARLTSNVGTQSHGAAAKAAPVVTVDLADGSATSGKILDGTKVTIDLADPKGATVQLTPAESQPRDQVSGEGYRPIYENEFLQPRLAPLSTFSIDVDKASYSNTRRFVTGGTLPPPDAVRIEELVNYFTYDYPQPGEDHPFSITTELAECPWNREHRLVHIGLQGRSVPLESLPPANIVFLVDVSGSMESHDKLPLLKQAFGLLVDQLRPEDKVAIVVYAGAAGLVLPPTSGRDKGTIRSALTRLSAGGSTAGGAGIKLAYETAKKNFLETGNNRVILATDGDFNVGVSGDEELVKLIESQRDHGIFLTVLGFGTGNYQDSKMEQLADNGNGNYAYVDRIEEAKKVFINEVGGTLLTIAKDVKLQIEFDQSKVESYRLIGYENRVLRDVDFDDDRKDAGELGAGHSVTALYEIVPRGSALRGAATMSSDDDTLQGPEAWKENEFMRVKLRYKAPTETVSKLLTVPVTDRGLRIETTSNNFRFSAAVAGLGLLLRNSRHKGTASYDDVLKLATGAKGNDKEGYRADFITLVQQCKKLASPTASR